MNQTMEGLSKKMHEILHSEDVNLLIERTLAKHRGEEWLENWLSKKVVGIIFERLTDDEAEEAFRHNIRKATIGNTKAGLDELIGNDVRVLVKERLAQ